MHHRCLAFMGLQRGFLDRDIVLGARRAMLERLAAAGVLAPDRPPMDAIFGGDDARGLFGGNGAWDISEVRRGRFVAVERVGTDLRLEMVLDHTGAGTDGSGVEAGSAGGS